MSDELQKAKNYAFLLLKYRPRSEREIAQRLKRKKFSSPAIKETVDFLRDKKFIDDRAFAKGWIFSRLKKPFGLRKIKQELNIKGIDPGIIEDEFAGLRQDYSEARIVRELAQKRWAKLKGIEREKAKSRIYVWFLRRGFAANIVIEAVNQL